MKKIRLMVLTLCFTMLISVGVYAEEVENKTITEDSVGEEVDLSVLFSFDANYYAIKYPEVVAIYGTDPNALYMHYITIGINEGKFPNEYMDNTMRYDLPYETFVDVDIDKQHVYYYNKGILVMDSPCVTGNVAEHRDTPKGVWKVRTHTKGKWLIGPTWKSWVDYWMCFTPDACGLHDAKWRKQAEFLDSTTYLKNGSHGCVNLPHDFAERLFNAINIGTIVVVH